MVDLLQAALKITEGVRDSFVPPAWILQAKMWA